MILYTIIGALTFGMLFWFGTAPAMQVPVEECVTVAEGLAEVGAGMIAVHPSVTLFVQPDTEAGRALQGLRDRAVSRSVRIRVCIPTQGASK